MLALKNMLLYCGLNKEEYEGITPLIAERNYSFTSIISLAMTAFGLIFLIFQLISGATVLFPYLLLIGCGAAFFLIGRYVLSKAGRFTLPFCYLQMSAIIIFAIILSAQGTNPENPATSIIVFLALLPLTINDRPLRMFSVVAFYATVYLICSAQVKVPESHQADIMNTLTFSLLGMMVYLLISNRNVHEIFLRQKAAESDRLREEKRAADMANAAKSEFLANMSHEIRTPINAILGMNEIILREGHNGLEHAGADPESIRESFRSICSDASIIRVAGHNLLSIINDILDFSKIEAGKMEIMAGSYHLGSVLSDVSLFIALKAKEKGIDFRLQVDETLPSLLYGDEVRVRQVITNLLNNAVKYTNAGSVQLSVSREGTGPLTENGTVTLIVTVRDTGIGIREEDMSRLFARFERIDLDMNSTVEGTGLGLAITRQLLNMMGGGITAESAYGKGSAFTVRLPQKIVSAEPVGNIRQKYEKNTPDEKPYRESFHAPDGHILVVDDTRMNITVVAGLLKKTQLNIDAAESGADAIRLCQAKRYDVILMDQRMPQMDGTEAMRRIRRQRDAINAETPFICLTADAVNGARERYLAEGFTDYLTKPINSHGLEMMLKKYLPPEKVQVVQETDNDAPQAAEPACYAQMRSAGIDPAAGLNYCQNDPEFYHSVLREYALSAPEKAEKLRQAYLAQDWTNYVIYAHSLKSTSIFIGASGLGEMAVRMESAAEERNMAALRADHAVLMEQYRQVVDAIRPLAPEPPVPASGGEDEIMEFMPEMPDPADGTPAEGGTPAV